MVLTTPTRVCNPPALPEYLKNVQDLKPIVGVPTDDEVKAVHAVIRAAQTVSQVPGMFDPDLSISLAQQLFEVQMGTVIGILVVCFRRYVIIIKDTSSILRNLRQDIVHTPPALPSHVPISLKPINGVPSDEELKSAHAAVRAYDQMSIVPSMFDPNIGMELSQHVFNIQFCKSPSARYMNQTRGELGPKPEPRSSARAHHPVDLLADASDEEDPVMSKEAETRHPVEPPSVANVQPPGDNTAPLAAERDPGWISKNLIDTMKVVKALVSCQRIHARFIRGSYGVQGNGRGIIKRYEVMNEKGELPISQGLPLVERGWNFHLFNAFSISDSVLAQYLQFYDIC